MEEKTIIPSLVCLADRGPIFSRSGKGPALDFFLQFQACVDKTTARRWNYFYADGLSYKERCLQLMIDTHEAKSFRREELSKHRISMTNQDAKLVLSAYRPNGADARDPFFEQALQQANRDPELTEWFEKTTRVRPRDCRETA